MKPSSILIPLTTLILGITIGWFAKPDPAAPVPPIASAFKPNASATPTPSHSDQARPTKTERPHPSAAADTTPDDDEAPDPEAEAEGQRMVEQMRKAAVDRFRKKLEHYVATIDQDLSLSPEQKAQLKTAIEAQLAEFTQLMANEGGSREVFDKLPDLGIPALETSLSASLDPTQKAALETYKSKERARQADTKALKKLALLQGIVDFKDGQRDEAYRLLSESAADSLAKADASANASSSFNDIFASASGMEMDPYDLGLQQLMMESAQNLKATGGDDNANSDGDNKAMMEAFRQKVGQLIEDRVNELKPVLDEAQLEKYREELRTKGLGPYGAILSNGQPEQ